jgi:hypothetical protein
MKEHDLKLMDTHALFIPVITWCEADASHGGTRTLFKFYQKKNLSNPFLAG